MAGLNRQRVGRLRGAAAAGGRRAKGTEDAQRHRDAGGGRHRGAKVWKQVRDWAIQHRMLSAKELDVLVVAASPGKIPTDNRSILIMRALDKLRKAGCILGPR